jgi:hypothetical protein
MALAAVSEVALLILLDAVCAALAALQIPSSHRYQLLIVTSSIKESYRSAREALF